MQKKRFWILIGIGVVLVFGFILLNVIISVGERLRSIHVYVEYGFYVISVVLIYILVINPVRVITFAPTFSIDALLDDDNKRHKIYKDAAKILVKNDYLTDEDKMNLSNHMGNKDELKDALTVVFDTTIKEEINKLIIKNSTTVLVSTALSQNGNLDMLSVVAINLKMIKEIVQLSGFRPTYPNLAKLSLNVLITSLIAEGLEDIEVSELLPNKISETLTDIPFVKTISSSIFSGIANGMLTCRVGVVTRSYLFNDNKLLTKKEIRRMAYIESLKMMPIIIKDGLTVFPKSVSNIFIKPFKKRAKKAAAKSE
ncbi:MAG: YcjF family protein [Candidatus Izimaplasma sp.]|nr:YcjF family protein [Candidatus Izimaplasma bacterium]